MEPDLARAVADLMGLKAEISLVPFTAALPGLHSARYDVSFGQIYIRAERLEIVDMVTDWKTFNTFVHRGVPKKDPESIADVCGLRVGAMAGSVQLKALLASEEICGDKPIDVQSFPSLANAALALTAGRLDVIFVNPDTAREVIKNDPSAKQSGRIKECVAAIAVSRSGRANGLSGAIKAALDHLHQSGEYMEILKKYGTDYGAISDFRIYTATDESPLYE